MNVWNLPAVFTIIVVICMTVTLAMEILPSGVVLAGALLIFFLAGIISPAETVAGISNTGVLTVALLFIVSAGIIYTGALNPVIHFIFRKKRKKGLKRALFRMMVPMSFISAFLNNTPIVAIFTPLIKKWATRFNLSPSKLLIPLSYATIFGGICTLIGTSTNLVVHGMLLQNGFKGLSMFELTKIGLPCAVVGWLYMVFVGHKLLPERKDISASVRRDKKEYLIGMKVTSPCPLIGQSIKEAGLRNLQNLYLIEIEREDKRFGPVSHNERIHKGDILYFVGITEGLGDIEDIPGLVPSAHDIFEKELPAHSSHLVEAVVSNSSPLLGRTVKQVSFRERYSAGVIAIHRNGERIRSKVGGVHLKAGDVLLLLARDSFLKRWSDSRDFYLVSTVKNKDPKAYHRSFQAITILSLMVLLGTFGGFLPSVGGAKISMFYAAALAAGLMITFKCVTTNQAKRALDMNVLLTIACALGISKALHNSGAASGIASLLIGAAKSMGPTGVLAAVYILTSFFTEIITNNAAAALLFPVALSAAQQMGVDPRPFFIAVTIGASASFATPIGYQTNLMVQGAGEYKFKDYLKVGLPLNILFFIICTAVIPLFWKF